MVQEAAECWARGLSIDEFQELQENMIQDGAPEVPSSADEITELKVVRNLPTLAASLHVESEPNTVTNPLLLSNQPLTR